LEDDHRYVSTTQVAEVLGLGVTTVKRWVDEGILPARRTNGGHRKVRMSDVLRLMRESELPLENVRQLFPRSRKLDFSSAEIVRGQLNEALRETDVELVRSLILGAHQRGFPIHVLADDAIGPALIEIGHLWETGKINVMHEHRAMQLVLSALYELEASQSPKSETGQPIAIGGAPEGDPTIVPTLLAKMVLVEAGWDAINLGPNTPFSALAAGLDELKPRLIWLCVTHLETSAHFLSGFQQLYAEAKKRDIAVAIGGRGLTQTIREKMPYTTFGDGMGHLSAFAHNLHHRPGIPRKGRPPKNVPLE